jgi:hypothetical protein
MTTLLKFAPSGTRHEETQYHDKNLRGTVIGDAQGGPLNQKGWTVVGEEGWEAISPTGYVFPHEESKALVDAGLIPTKFAAAGGDVGGGGVYNYKRSRVGGRTARTSSARSGLMYDSSGVLGGSSGGADTLGAIIPEINEAVSGTVAQTIAQSAQMQALESSLAEQRKQVDILLALLEKTASANDIGRAVNGDMARQA